MYQKLSGFGYDLHHKFASEICIALRTISPRSGGTRTYKSIARGLTSHQKMLFAANGEKRKKSPYSKKLFFMKKSW